MRDQSNDSRLEGRVRNVNYNEDVRYVLQICHWFLKPIGIWTFVGNKPNRSERILSAFIITMCSFIMCAVSIPYGHYLLMQEKDLYMRIKLVGPLIYLVICMIKYIYLGLNASAFQRCLTHVQKDWKTFEEKDHRVIMMENVTIGRNLTLFQACFLYTGGMSYHTIMPFISSNGGNGNQTIRPLVYIGYDVFFDSQKSPVYELLFFMHCLTALIMFTITSAECGLATCFVTHACGQIQVQMARLKNLINELENKKSGFTDPLNVIVENHVETLRFSKDIEEVLRGICFFEIFVSTLVICLAEYCCVLEWNNSNAVATSTYFLLLVSFAFNILIFCYIGELLVEQCREIGVTSYDVEWYNLPERRALDLILMIAISNYPPKLTAGKICDLSLTTFGNVIKSSMVYLNLLWTVLEW